MWKEAEKFLAKDKYIAPLIKKWGSPKIRSIKKALYFEDLVSAITNQQLSGKAASTIFGRAKGLCKGGISPEAIIKLSEAKLRSAGLSFAKIKYVKNLAIQVKNSKLKIKNLDKLEDNEVVEQLIQVKGIGRWTAEMFLMFSLGRQDVFPVDDLGIKKGLRLVEPQGSERFENKEYMKKFAERWRPYRTAASWYLWRSLENR